MGVRDLCASHKLELLHEVRRQAPARRTPTPLLMGGPGDEVADTNRCWQERLPHGASASRSSTISELTQAELAKDLGFWPATAKGWTRTWQRCRRYDYRKCLTHLTNPDHLVASVPSPTNLPPLRIAARYAAGPKHG